MPFVARSAMAAVAVALAAASASAAPIIPGTTIFVSTADQTIDLFAGTPFNPTGDTITIRLTSAGSFTIDRQAQVGSTIPLTLSAAYTGTLPGPLPPAAFSLFAGTPGLPTSTGNIFNVVQDPLDPGFAAGLPSSLVSGDMPISTYFGLTVAALGATVYSDPNQAAMFFGVLDGLPASPGTTFTSPERVDLYLQLGPGLDTTRDLLIGQSYDRVVTSVAPTPVPATAVAIVLGGLGLGLVRRRRG